MYKNIYPKIVTIAEDKKYIFLWLSILTFISYYNSHRWYVMVI